jgi:hypothetical protein
MKFSVPPLAELATRVSSVLPIIVVEAPSRNWNVNDCVLLEKSRTVLIT